MKKLLIAALAVTFVMASCKDATTTSNSSGQRDKNMAANKVIDNAFKTGDVSGLDSVIADDFLDHTDQGDKKGRDSLKAMVNMIHTNFKDMKMETIHEMADDEFVFSWMRYSGNSDGSMGMPKGPYTMNSVEVAKFKDGKAVEHWAFVDMKDMMKMMPPPPPPAKNSDTTHK